VLTIGRFARACRLTVKALRHYDEVGLLHPAYVDPHTGYRYYTGEQVEQAVLIALMRQQLELPVPTVREILACGPAQRQLLLQREHERLQREIVARQQARRTLERLLRQGGELRLPEVHVRQEPECRLATLPVQTDAEQHVQDTQRLVDELLSLLRQAGCPEPEQVLCCVPASREDWAMLVGVSVPDTLAALPPARIETLPGGPAAFVRHVGPYEELGLAHHALIAWARAEGHAVDTLREIYLDDPREVAPEELVTEVLLPLGG
jgi:DNA-binding transcriptional MerR regulator